MFSFLTGKIFAIDENSITLECNGIGYEILVPSRILNNLSETTEEVRLFVKLIVRENEVYFVGFLTQDEKKVFELLLTVNGLGVKQSLKILSELPIDEIRKAIVTKNEKIFSNVKGIGSKTASRIVLELYDKIRQLELSEKYENIDGVEKKRLEVLMALRVLGYSDFEAKKAIDIIFSDKNYVVNNSVENIIKKLLSNMIK